MTGLAESESPVLRVERCVASPWPVSSSGCSANVVPFNDQAVTTLGGHLLKQNYLETTSLGLDHSGLRFAAPGHIQNE